MKLTQFVNYILNELDTSTLKNYAKKAATMNPKKPMGKILQHANGANKAIDKIAVKIGDKTPNHKATRDEVFAESFGPVVDALLKESYSHFGFEEDVDYASLTSYKKPEVKKMPMKNTNYLLWYREPKNEFAEVSWQIRSKTKEEIVHQAKSPTLKDAWKDAEEWMATKSAHSNSTGNVTVNFNATFARQFGAEGATIYCAIWEGPTLVISYKPQNGLNKTAIRTPERNRTAGAALLPVTVVGPKQANKVNLKGDSYYTLGPKQDLDDETFAFELIWKGSVESGVRIRNEKEPIVQTSKGQ